MHEAMIKTVTGGEAHIAGFDWERLSDGVAAAFRLTPHEKEIFKSRPVAELIGALPFLAGADDPERTAIRNLGVYLLSVRGATEPYFNPVPADDTDLFRRLRPYTEMRGGNQAIIDKALNLLAYHMVCDYERDVQEDGDSGQYNPVGAGVLDAKSVKLACLDQWKTISCPAMDEVMEAGTEAWWWN